MSDERRRSARDLLLRLRRKAQYTLYRQRWNVAITPFSAAAVAGLEGAAVQRAALDALDWMPERGDAFVADPFVTRDPHRPDTLLIFYELFPWQRAQGLIGAARYNDGRFEEGRIVLDTGHHLSYPFVLGEGETLRVMPEHSAASDLSSYAVAADATLTDPRPVEREHRLIDATIVEWEGRHWLFCTHAGPTENSELHAYHAAGPAGPWTPHRANPIRRDRGGARPAGAFIVQGGKLFRPAQDCRAHYGAGIVVHAVERLTADEYRETVVSEIRPPAGSRYDYGLHTISSVGTHTVIDGARMESLIHPRLDRWGRYLRA
jgi:hypothetical protein